MDAALAAVSCFTGLACAWLTVMFVVLGHPGYAWRATMAATVAAYSVLAVAAAVGAVRGTRLRGALVVGGCAAVALGAIVVYQTLSGPDFDGFWLPIGAGLGVQGALTIARMTRAPRPSRAA
jgi:hypothetical protein